MDVSILIPTHNDFQFLDDTITKYLSSSPYDVDAEVIIVNDGSVKNDGSPVDMTNWFGYLGGLVRVIQNKKNYGVGYGFDRASGESRGEIIILTASDILPKGEDFLNDVIRVVKQHPDEMGCATCLGLSPNNLDLDNPNDHYYGADLLWKHEGFDEKRKSALLKTDGTYKSVLDGRWRKTLAGGEPYEISCLMGACYFMTRELYLKIHGFDTVKDEEWMGHKKWGSLEPFLSVKAMVYGVKMRLYPDIQVGHVFNRPISGSRSREYQFWNKLWVMETMLGEELREELYSFLRPELNLNIARSWVRQHRKSIDAVRERNAKEGHLICNVG